MRRTVLAVLLPVVFGLSACGTLNGKSPQDMMKIAMERSTKQDSSYNFSGEMRIFLSEKNKGAPSDSQAFEKSRKTALKEGDTEKAGQTDGYEGVLPMKSADKESKLSDGEDTGNNETATLSLADESVSGADENAAEGDLLSTILGSSEESENVGVLATRALEQYPNLTQYLESGRLKYAGAVDLREELLELTPELLMRGRNEYSSMKLPLLFDLKNLSLTVEAPGSLTAILDFFVVSPMRLRMLNEPFRFTLPKDTLDDMPLRNIVRAWILASYNAYGDLPQNAYRLAEKDEFAKELGAKYRLEIRWDKPTKTAYADAFTKAYRQHFDYLQKTLPEQNIDEQKIEEARDSAEKLSKAMAEFDFKKYFGSDYYTSFYLNRNGRVLGVRNYAQVNAEQHVLNIDANLVYRYGKPVFTLDRNRQDVITFTDLSEAFMWNEKSKQSAKDEGHDIGYQSESADSLEKSDEVRKPVVKKHHRR